MNNDIFYLIGTFYRGRTLRTLKHNNLFIDCKCLFFLFSNAIIAVVFTGIKKTFTKATIDIARIQVYGTQMRLQSRIVLDYRGFWVESIFSTNVLFLNQVLSAGRGNFKLHSHYFIFIEIDNWLLSVLQHFKLSHLVSEMVFIIFMIPVRAMKTRMWFILILLDQLLFVFCFCD